MPVQSHSDHANQTDDLLTVEETDSYRLELRLSDDRMECVAVFAFKPHAEKESAPDSPEDEHESVKVTEKNFPPSPLTASELVACLNRHGITQTIDFSAVYEFCATIDQGLTPEPAVLARGKAPVAGADGWFELLVKVSGEEQFVPDSKGRVDLKRLNAYSEIEPEQKLGVIHPPEIGEPGCTVDGKELPAPLGRPVPLVAGEGVILKYGRRMAFAEKAGRALYEKNRLSVVDQLVINGDVDLKVGHIDFNGFVEIKGDVLDDFDVRSTKGIKISGYVGACHIESRGSVEIGAMAGREIGRILCQGDLRAGFLNQVTVICYGDVEVAKEIRHSIIKTTGHVIAERGVIIGGECVALKGVCAAVIGADSGHKTLVTAGVYFPDAERFEYLRKQVHSVEQHIEAVRSAIGPLMQHLHKDSKFIDTARVRLQVLNDQLDRLYLQKNAFNAELAASQPQHLTSRNPKINVFKNLKEGVVVTLGKAREVIRTNRTGPLTLIENTRDGGLRYLGLTPLPVTAMEIESDLLEQG